MYCDENAILTCLLILNYFFEFKLRLYESNVCEYNLLSPAGVRMEQSYYVVPMMVQWPT